MLDGLFDFALSRKRKADKDFKAARSLRAKRRAFRRAAFWGWVAFAIHRQAGGFKGTET